MTVRHAQIKAGHLLARNVGTAVLDAADLCQIHRGIGGWNPSRHGLSSMRLADFSRSESLEAYQLSAKAYDTQRQVGKSQRHHGQFLLKEIARLMPRPGFVGGTAGIHF